MIPGLLLAQSNHLDRLWDEFSASFRGDRSTMTTFTTRFAVAIIVVLFLLVFAWMIRSALRQRDPASGPNSLLRAAMHAAGFGWLDRRLVIRAARRADLEHPVVMLIVPQVFRDSTTVWLAAMPLGFLRPWARGRLNALHEQLFGPPPAAP